MDSTTKTTSQYKTTDEYFLVNEDASTIPVTWFDRQRRRYLPEAEVFTAFKSREIEVLQAYHDGKMTAEEAAHAITLPISTSPIPPCNSEEDEILSLMQLWRLLKDALIEWPCNWTPRLIALLLAIAKTPNSIHQNKAIDDYGNPFQWRHLPGIFMVWSDAHWMQPIQIIQECTNVTDRAHAREIYLKEQMVASRLVAADVFQKEMAYCHIVFILGRSPSDKEWITRFVPDFHIPAVAHWMRYNKDILSQAIMTGELEVRTGGGPTFRKVGLTAECLSSWKEQLKEYAREGQAELLRSAACEVVSHLEVVMATAHEGR